MILHRHEILWFAFWSSVAIILFLAQLAGVVG